MVDAGLRLSGYSKEEAERTRREWENYPRNTGKEELNPDNIKREIEVLVHDPKKGAALLIIQKAERMKAEVKRRMTRRRRPPAGMTKK